MLPWIQSNKRRKSTQDHACDPPAQQHDKDDSDSTSEEDEPQQQQSLRQNDRSAAQSRDMNSVLTRIRGDASAARSRGASSNPNSNRPRESIATEALASPIPQQPVSDASSESDYHALAC